MKLTTRMKNYSVHHKHQKQRVGIKETVTEYHNTFVKTNRSESGPESKLYLCGQYLGVVNHKDESQ